MACHCTVEVLVVLAALSLSRVIEINGVVVVRVEAIVVIGVVNVVTIGECAKVFVSLRPLYLL